MWNRIKTIFLGTPSPKGTLAEILSDSFNQEFFLGVRRDAPPSPNKMNQDVDRVIQYARTEDYAIWAQEAWSYVLDCVDKLSDPALESWKVDFYRGGLARTIETLRISYKAIYARQDARDISNKQK